MEQVLREFKRRMKIYHATEDEMLTNILQTSYDDIQQLVGEFDINLFSTGKELVFERARYVYNDSLEYFYVNFQQRILDLSMELMGGNNDISQL